MNSPQAMHPAIYRVYQFIAAVRAYLPPRAGGLSNGLIPADEALVNLILPALAQRALFYRMSPNDRRHALAVARTLQQAGHTDPALLQAALLHDAGKSLGQPLIHRALIVLLQAFWPALLRRLSRSTRQTLLADFAPDSRPPAVFSPAWWRRPFVVHAHHPAIAAAWAREAGCDPRAVDLIGRHEDKFAAAEDGLLAALQWADDLN